MGSSLIFSRHTIVCVDRLLCTMHIMHILRFYNIIYDMTIAALIKYSLLPWRTQHNNNNTTRLQKGIPSTYIECCSYCAYNTYEHTLHKTYYTTTTAILLLIIIHLTGGDVVLPGRGCWGFCIIIIKYVQKNPFCEHIHNQHPIRLNHYGSTRQTLRLAATGFFFAGFGRFGNIVIL